MCCRQSEQLSSALVAFVPSARAGRVVLAEVVRMDEERRAMGPSALVFRLSFEDWPASVEWLTYCVSMMSVLLWTAAARRDLRRQDMRLVPSKRRDASTSSVRQR